MITPAYVRIMAAYNSEMNRRTYDAAGRLTDEERRAPRGAFWGSIHGTLAHLLWADQMWMSRFDGWERPACKLAESADDAGSFDALRARREAADTKLGDWARTIDGHWLGADQTWFSGASGREMTKPRVLLVMHLFNHQTHHRGQVHAMLTATGQDTGSTDLPFVLPEPAHLDA